MSQRGAGPCVQQERKSRAVYTSRKSRDVVYLQQEEQGRGVPTAGGAGPVYTTRVPRSSAQSGLPASTSPWVHPSCPPLTRHVRSTDVSIRAEMRRGGSGLCSSSLTWVAGPGLFFSSQNCLVSSVMRASASEISLVSETKDRMCGGQLRLWQLSGVI